MQTVLLPGRMHRQPCPPSHSPQCQQLRPAAAHRASGPLQHLRRAARQRRCLATRAGAIQELMAEELQVAIADRDRPLLIDFSAEWCGPCRLLTAELEAVAKELGDKVRIIKVDTDKNPDLSSQLRIEGLPTMVFVGMQPDKPALRVEGLHAAKVIVEIFENEILAPASASQ